jgi:hypothetical protein
MNRKSVFIAATLLVAGLAGTVAEAKQWGCWIQRDRNIAIRNASGGTQAANAISDWHNMTILNFNYVSSGEEIYVFNANSGATGWGGLASITNYSGCNIIRATAQVNTYYFSASSLSARGVHCQEIGHGFGLDHSNDGGCMGGGYWYSISNAYRPVTYNVNFVANMYANRDVNPNHPTPGPEADAPKFHANWANTPRSIGEATRLASDVVVATVTARTDGDDIVSRAKDGYVQRIPTERVHFTVMRSPKGEMVAGESFVLFQNGNEQNRFDEDPSYKVGSRHLLFLLERGDGTYLVVSPEGRYQMTGKGLEPASHQGFAAGLKGASLKDVLADVGLALN